mmetsp:Transcript_8206/g.11810  ORF Transcript_8206/g.11810 Transcript_8206/m.11810 type:complete len:267 (+) Transcript_8206:87-887(+)
MKPFFLILTLNVSLLAAWTALARIEYRVIISGNSVDQFGRNDTFIGICTPTNRLASKVSEIFLLSINLLVVLLTSYYAYHSRKASTQYNESHYIAISVYIIFQLSLFLAMVYGFYFASLNPTLIFYIFAIVVLSLSLGILIPLFVPKVIALQDERRKDIEKEKKKAERLKRLQRYDELRAMEGEGDDKNINRVTEKTASVDSISNTEMTSIDDCVGSQIIILSEREGNKLLKSELSTVMKENKQLSESIKSAKDSLKINVSSESKT